MPRNYAKPPVAEAICEFQFLSAQEWDWTIPGLIYQKISSEFPEKRQEKSFEINIAPQEDNAVQHVGGGLSKMQFLRADGSAMVQIGPNLLAINVRSPYPGWKQFAELIGRQLEVYLSIAKATGFKRIGLRYINRIEFQVTAMELTEFFDYYPHLPQTIEQKHGPFAMRVTRSYFDGRDMMSVQLANAPAKTLTYVLDIDYSLVQVDKVQLSKGLEWVTEAHLNVEEMFEACITPKTREHFGEEK